VGSVWFYRQAAQTYIEKHFDAGQVVLEEVEALTTDGVTSDGRDYHLIAP
jgi:hypothetical protein